MKSAKELLREKRDGASWTDAEITHFVQGVTDGTISPPQAAAFLMAACIHGLTRQETASLTRAMAQSGLPLRRVVTSVSRADKHSTGGVGDKVSLLLAPLVASCGVHVPMISGRGLGHTGGTLDKLESVVGLRTDLSDEEMSDGIALHGFFMAGQTSYLAPADKILYALRDATGTVENIGLITASILSKKLCEDLDGLVMDMKVGKGAFMTSLEQAQQLAESIRSVCNSIELPVRFIFSRMDFPLGNAVGNWCEMLEAERALAGTCSPDLYELTMECAIHMLLCIGAQPTRSQAEMALTNAWQSGEAHQRFHSMVKAQGGDWQASLEKYHRNTRREIRSTMDGPVSRLPARELAAILNRFGAGRMKETDSIDHAVGYTQTVQAGTVVSSGSVIGIAESSHPMATVAIAEEITMLYKTATAPNISEPSVIIDVWS